MMMNFKKHTLNRRSFLTYSTAAAGSLFASSCQNKRNEFGDYKGPLPNNAQLAWQNAEFGLVYHYDLHIFDKENYVQSENRVNAYEDPNIFNPTELDTGQWIDAAKACGASFAIITASHETGFRLWQSDVNPYSLSSVEWGNGNRDIVGEFIESCRKAGIAPGVYFGARWNSRLGVFDFKVTERSRITQEEYNQLIVAEVKEICTRYGPLFELWFDGGILAPEDGGPDVLPVVEKYQPDCLFYHSDQRRDARWGGTESGTVGYPCWATIDLEKIETGEWSEEKRKLLMHGDPHGSDWCPAMSDAPLRNHEWFWNPGEEQKIYPLEALIEMYYKSVGRNSTLIIGVTPDDRGLVPEADTARLREMGDVLRERFVKMFKTVSGTGSEIVLALPKPSNGGNIIIQEDIAKGERVRSYTVEYLGNDGTWAPLCEGTCIGHKRIHEVPPNTVSPFEKLRLIIAASNGLPLIKSFGISG